MADVIAGVEHPEIDTVAWGWREIKQCQDFGLEWRVGREIFGFAAAVADGTNDPRNCCFGAPGNDHAMTFGSKAPGQRGAESLFGTNAHNDSRTLKRGHLELPRAPDARTGHKAPSVSVGCLRQWPAENKIAVAQFGCAGKNPSKERTGGVKSLLLAERGRS